MERRNNRKGNKAMKRLLGSGLFVTVSMLMISVVDARAEARTIEITGNDTIQHQGH